MVLQAWQRRFVQVGLGKVKGGFPGAAPSSGPLSLTLSLQLAQEALPANASQQIHAFSSTTLDDVLHAFSEVSTTRVVGGYLLMVGPAPSNLASPPASSPGNPCLRSHPLSTAGLCLRNNATVGLRPVPGRRRSCWGAAGGPGGGLRSWALRPTWHHFQCCHYSGKPGLGTGGSLWGHLQATQPLQMFDSLFGPSRCCPSWLWASAWTTSSCWHMPSQRPHPTPLSQ